MDLPSLNIRVIPFQIFASEANGIRDALPFLKVKYDVVHGGS